MKRSSVLIAIFCIAFSSCNLFNNSIQFQSLKYLPPKIICDVPTNPIAKNIFDSTRNIQTNTYLKGYSPMNFLSAAFLSSYYMIYATAVQAVIADMVYDNLKTNEKSKIEIVFTEPMQEAALSLIQRSYALGTDQSQILSIDHSYDCVVTKRSPTEEFEYIVEFSSESSMSVIPMTLKWKEDKTMFEVDGGFNNHNTNTFSHFYLSYNVESELTAFYSDFEDFEPDAHFPRTYENYTLCPVGDGIVISALNARDTIIQDKIDITSQSAFLYANSEFCSGTYFSNNTLHFVNDNTWTFLLGPSITQCVEPMSSQIGDRWYQIYDIGEESWNGTDVGRPDWATNMIANNNARKEWSFFEKVKSIDIFNDYNPENIGWFMTKYYQIQGIKQNECYIVFSDLATIESPYIVDSLINDSPIFIGYFFGVADGIGELHVCKSKPYNLASNLYLHKVVKKDYSYQPDKYEKIVTFIMSK